MIRLTSICLICLLVAACSQPDKSSNAKGGIAVGDSIQSPPHINIDIVKASPDKAKVLMENEHVRVVEYTLKPGESDEWHTHPPKSGYVVSGGKLKVYLENGESFIAEETTGSTFWDGYVGKHHGENIGNTTVTIVLTEVKALQ